MAMKVKTAFIYISKSYQLFFYVYIAKLFTKRKSSPRFLSVHSNCTLPS